MKISEIPELREYRDDLARKIHRKRGGDYLAAVGEANITTRRVYARAVGGKRRAGLSDAAVRETVGRTIAGARRGTVARPSRGGKTRRKKGRDAALRETVSQAIGKVLAEAASRPRTPTAAPSVPLAEMSHEDLAAAITEASRAAANSPRVTESSGTPDPALTSEPAGPLHELDWEAWEEHAGGVLTGQARTELVSPFWAGAGAPRSPFWRGLDG